MRAELALSRGLVTLTGADPAPPPVLLPLPDAFKTSGLAASTEVAATAVLW